MKAKTVYHVGIGKRDQTMVIQARRDVDYLDCEIYDYMGKRETTKTALRANRYGILKLMQDKRPDIYGSLKYAIVD